MPIFMTLAFILATTGSTPVMHSRMIRLSCFLTLIIRVRLFCQKWLY